MSKGSSTNFLFISVVETVKCYSVSAVLSFGILLIVSLCVNSVTLYYIGGILFLMPLLEPLVVKWKPKERISPAGKAVFITGCDRGFGYMCAQRLDDIGFQVFAGCLFPDGEGATNLRKSGSDRLHVMGLDVTKDNSVEEAVTYVKKFLNGNVLWAVINNAGIVDGGELEWTELSIIKKVIEVNTIGVVRVSKAFLPLLKEFKGRIITMSSLAALHCLPWAISYCMSKSAATSFSDGLRMEMHKWGVKIITIEPSLYKTAIVDDVYRNAEKTFEKTEKQLSEVYGSDYLNKSLKKSMNLLKRFSNDPTEVVSVIEEAVTVQTPEFFYRPGNLFSWFVSWMFRKVPNPLVDLIIICFQKMCTSLPE